MLCSDILCAITTLRFENLVIRNTLILHFLKDLEEGPPPVTAPTLIKCQIPALVICLTSNSIRNGVSTSSTWTQIRPNAHFQFGIVEMQIGIIGQ